MQDMRQVGGTEKGVFGEKAALRVCEEIYQQCGGILYHSYTYKSSPGLPGNIKRGPDGFYLMPVGSVTEIDVLLVTPFKVFPLEIKAYKANRIVLTDERISGCAVTEKSPIHQNEMHCRHLYPDLVRALPEGSTKYIEPVVVFVDKCTLEDNRSSWQKAYIKAATLNTLRSCLVTLNRPLEYRIDLGVMAKCLEESCVSCEKYFKLRYVKGGQ